MKSTKIHQQNIIASFILPFPCEIPFEAKMDLLFFRMESGTSKTNISALMFKKNVSIWVSRSWVKNLRNLVSRSACNFQSHLMTGFQRLSNMSCNCYQSIEVFHSLKQPISNQNPINLPFFSGADGEGNTTMDPSTLSYRKWNLNFFLLPVLVSHVEQWRHRTNIWETMIMFFRFQTFHRNENWIKGWNEKNNQTGGPWQKFLSV